MNALEPGPESTRSPDAQTGAGPAWALVDLIATLACGLLACMIALEPHLTALVANQTTTYVGDADDAYYIALYRPAYYGESRLRDPYCGEWEGVPSLYSWFPAAYFAQIAGWFKLGPFAMAVLWRGCGGFLCGAVFHTLFRTLFQGFRRARPLALLSAIIAVADAGLVDGRSFVSNFGLVVSMFKGSIPWDKPDAIALYRVVPPLLTLTLPLAVVALLDRTDGPPKKVAVALAAIVFGLCINAYFFFWTALTAALAMSLCFEFLTGAIWISHRDQAWRRARATATVLLIGGLIGAPRVLEQQRSFEDQSTSPILARMLKPCPLEPNDPARSRYIRNTWIWLKLGIGIAGFAAFRPPRARVAWMLALSAYALENSALVTGLEFENFHWNYLASPCGEVVVLTQLGTWVDGLGKRSGARALGSMALLSTAFVAIALAWRPYESLHAPDAVRNRLIQLELRPLASALTRLGPEEMLAGPREADFAVLYGRAARLYASPYSWTSLISDNSLHERHALNGWLQGLSASEYAEVAGLDKYSDDLPREEWRTAAVGRARVAWFRIFERDAGRASATLERLHVDVLLLPRDATIPTRGGPWTMEVQSPRWSLWRRRSATGSSVRGIPD